MKSISKVLILLVAACLACSITAQNTCMSQCGSGCYVDYASQRCRSCPAGCANCTNPDTCDICATGYYLNEERNCVPCNVSGCATCNAQGVCATCQSGYFLKNSSSCVYCGYLCEECESETKCKKCRNDEYMYYGVYRSTRLGTCNYCPDGCKTCVSSGFCTSCKTGYTLSDFQCITCSTIDSDCRTCDETVTQCTSCGPGRYLLNNACLECSSGCETCMDDSTCQKCMEGYFLNANGGCTPCMSGCRECRSPFTCDKCYDGSEYDAQKGRCVSCELDCYGVNTPYLPFIGCFDYAAPVAMSAAAAPMMRAEAMPMTMSSFGGAGMGFYSGDEIVDADTETQLAKAEAIAEIARIKAEEEAKVENSGTTTNAVADEVNSIKTNDIITN